MDTNVVGRKFNDHVAAEDEWPKVKRIIVRGLTDETHGNATGIGMAEFCRRRVRRADGPEDHADQLPHRRPSDRRHAAARLSTPTARCLDAALPTIGLTEPPDATLLWIHNTLRRGRGRMLRAPIWNEARERDDLEILTEPRELEFDAGGDLVDFEPALAGQMH